MVEPACAMFIQHCLRNSQVKQTANVVLTNLTDKKLIFVICQSKSQPYIIRPVADFFLPRKSRSVTISMLCDAVEPGKRHFILFLVAPIRWECGIGMKAIKYFENNKSTIMKNAVKGRILCVETMKTQAMLRRVTSAISIPRVSEVSSGGAEQDVTYGKFVLRRAPTSTGKQSPPEDPSSPDDRASPPSVVRTLSSREIISIGSSEMEKAKPTPSHKHLTEMKTPENANMDLPFWQDAVSLRAFCYGFVLSFVITFIIILTI